MSSPANVCALLLSLGTCGSVACSSTSSDDDGGRPMQDGSPAGADGASTIDASADGSAIALDGDLVDARPGEGGTSSPCEVALGEGADLGGALTFPIDNAWNLDVSAAPLDPRSDAIIARVGPDAPVHPDFGSGLYAGARIGIPYVVVPADQPLVRVDFLAYPGESDPGPYPIPPDAPIEGAGTTASYSDAHVLVVQLDTARCLDRLYELFRAEPVGGPPTQWNASNGAVFEAKSNDLRPARWTSADAAGLPIFPGLVRYDEVARAVASGGVVPHAIRFTLENSHTRRAYVPPATHWASTNDDEDLAPFGMRVRLKASYEIPSDASPEAQAILRTMKVHGMLLADNGSDWFVSGAPDERWDNDDLRALREVHGRDFEVVRMDGLVTP